MNSEHPTGVLVVDDDALVRAWLRFALAGSEYRIVGEADSISQALELYQRRRPQLLLVDYHLRDGLGTELLQQLREHRGTCQALLLTATPEQGLNEAAREAGAHGTLLKTDAEALLRALRIVSAGGRCFDPSHPRRPAGRGPLSSREREILALIADGATNRDVAAQLGITVETVKTLVTRIYSKLGTHKRAEAVSEAHRQGLL